MGLNPEHLSVRSCFVSATASDGFIWALSPDVEPQLGSARLPPAFASRDERAEPVNAAGKASDVTSVQQVEEKRVGCRDLMHA